MEVDDKIKMMDNDGAVLPNEVYKEVKRLAERVSIGDGDVVLLKGAWDHAMVEHMAHHLNTLKKRSLIIVLPDSKMDFSTMPISAFYDMMKAVEKEMGITPESDGVCGD